MIYSVQQLLFDTMSYLKEFGWEEGRWQVGAIGPSPPEGADRYAVWLHRPALSAKAADTVVQRLRHRFGVGQLPEPGADGRYVFLGKLAPPSR